MDKILERSNGSAIIELENNNIKKLFMIMVYQHPEI